MWVLQQISFVPHESSGLEQMSVLTGDIGVLRDDWLLRYNDNARKEEYHNGGGRDVRGAFTEKEKVK